jgi:hypothetical protein
MRSPALVAALLVATASLRSLDSHACGNGVRTEVRASSRTATISAGRSVTLFNGAIERFEIISGTAVVSLSRQGNRLVARALRIGEATVVLHLANAQQQRWSIRVGRGPSRCREPRPDRPAPDVE